MKQLGLALLLLVAFPTVAAAEGVLRLLGLDRIYFEHVGSPDRTLEAPDAVAALLPEAVDSGTGSEGGVPQDDPLHGLRVRDFALPPEDGHPRRWLRQIVDLENPRISETWWALYDDGGRGDVWRFQAVPHTHGKNLSNYRIEDIARAPDGAITLLVRGEMFRPHGAWWITGKAFSLARTDRGLELLRVRNDFGFFRGYDRLEAPAALSVSTEREVQGRFEERRMAVAPQELLDLCEFVDPLLDDAMLRSRERLEAVARCVTQHPEAVTTSRALDEPSFVERGGVMRD